jgi:flagellar protein FlaD
VTKWLEYLMGKVGSRLEEVLDYYVSIGWISNRVKRELLDYAYGMFVRKIENGEMSPRDHTVSMMFIEMLKKELKKG